ncbi:MAG: glycosyltransferase family 39 protein [Planctomycetaceae bacterium]|nr:glycosyltransferase family 39 protein [Planctomycetaceae bacterium]
MTSERSPSSIRPGIIAGAVWVVLFAWLFFDSDLQNAPSMSRWKFWQEVPFQLLDLLPGSQQFGDLPVGWSYFAPRQWLILAAGFISCGAWCLGRLLLRSLKLTQVGTVLERQTLALAVGYAALSLLTLGFGLAGLLVSNLFRGMLLAFVVADLLWTFLSRSLQPSAPSRKTAEPWILPYELMLPVIVIGSFLMCMLLGALLPSIDFDVKEYHLQGPKEWYLAGEITWLKHNVYTSFPFLTEMLSLTGMLVCGDWFFGALVGKAVLMSFAPLTAVALYCLGRRWFSPSVGWWAALIYLTTPWIYRVSIIAYTEGALMAYTAVTLLAFELSRSHLNEVATAKRLWMVTGMLAGSAMACKYPGLISVVVPISAAALVACVRRTRAESSSLPILKYAGFFILGGALAIGPWLLKNAAQTGNPVYPLAWSIFGGDDWNPELQAKWKDAHSPPHYRLANIPQDAWRILAGSDYQSLLLFAFAPLSWLWKEKRRLLGGLWIYLAWLFLSWWCFTHRIDRFWLPMIPVVSLLAAAGLQQLWQSRAKWLSAAVVGLAILFNFGLILSTRAGLNIYLADIEALAQSPIVQPPGILEMNESLQEGEKLLSVGEANVFDARFPLDYNTVFDISLLEEWCTDTDGEWLTVEEIRQNLQDAGITHVLVNWGEILRYRLTYRYTDFAVPESLDRLVEMGILTSPEPLTFKSLEEMSENERRETTSTLSGRVRTVQGTTGLITNETYRVLPE